jgi:hypothetical protein
VLTAAFHVVFVLAVAGAALALYRWISAKSKWLGLMVAAGVLLRLIGGVTAFAISYFDAPFMRSLHTGGGFWVLALDARFYYNIVSKAAAGSPFSITSDSSSPGYTIALALWLTATGISVLSAILFNTVCYLATAAVLVSGWSQSDRGPAASWTPVMIAAVSFSPVLLLTSTQVLKDPFFAMLIAMACRSAFALFECARYPIADRRATIVFAAAASVMLLTLIGAVRAYYAVLIWVAFLAGLAALIITGASSVWSRTRRALVGLVVLTALWVAFASGSGPYYGYYQVALAGSGVTNEIETSRRSFVNSGGGTNMAAPTPARQPPAPAPATASVVKRAVTGLAATFVPMAILKATPLVSFAGGKGLLFIADFDTIFLDATLVLLALTVWRHRTALVARAPGVAFVVTLAGVSTVLLAYVVTNFGTLLRLRLFVAVPIWVSVLALGSGGPPPAAALESVRRPLRVRRASLRVFGWLGLAAFLAMILAPGAPDSPFHGVPLSRPALAGLAAALVGVALVGLVRPARRMTDAWIAALLLAAMFKATTAFGATASGWRGVYELIDKQTIPILFTDGFALQPYRIDPQINFDGPTFKFPFRNDVARYGRASGSSSREVEAELRVRWVGYTALPAGGQLAWSVRCRGRLAVEVDNVRIFVTACPADAFGTFSHVLAPGTHKVAIVYAKPPGTSPLAVVTPTRGSPVASSRVAAGVEIRSTRLTLAATLIGWTGCALVALALALSYVPARGAPRVRSPGAFGRLAILSVFAILMALACGAAIAFHEAPTGIGLGDAAQAVESGARDLVASGLRPWRSSSLYEFMLAASHVVVGEDLSAAVFLNLTSLAAIVPLCWWIGWRRLGPAATLSAAVAMAAACTWYAWPVVTTTVDATFFTAMAFLAAALTARATESRAALWWLAAIVATGAAVATRPSFVIYAVVLAGLFAVGRRSVSSIWWALAAAMAGGAVIAGQWTWGARAELPLFAVLLLGVTLLMPKKS